MGMARCCGLAVASLMGACTGTNEFDVPLDDFAVAFLVTVSPQEGLPRVSSPLLHRSLQTETDALPSPEVSLKDDEQLFVIELPQSSASVRDVCWNRPITLVPRTESIPPLIEGRRAQDVHRDLPQDVRIRQAIEFSPGDDTLGPLEDKTPPWAENLRLAVNVDTEWGRPTDTMIVPLEAGLALSGFIANNAPFEVRQIAQLDANHLLVTLNTGLAVVNIDQPFSPETGQWLHLPRAGGLLWASATFTSTRGIEIISVGGARDRSWSQGTPNFQGVLFRTRFHPERGLDPDQIEFVPFPDRYLHSVHIDDGTVLVGGSQWPNNDPTGDRHVPILYRWNTHQALPEPDDVWQVIEPETSRRDHKAYRVAITGDERFPYGAVDIAGGLSYDASLNRWHQVPLVPQKDLVEKQDYPGFAVDPENPREWWATSDNGYVFRTTDYGQNWTEIDIHYPPRFSECGPQDDTRPHWRYEKEHIQSVVLTSNHVFLIPKICRAIVAINRSCLVNDGNYDRATCVSLLEPGPADVTSACTHQASEGMGWRISEKIDFRVSMIGWDEHIIVATEGGKLWMSQ